jgi:hemoglobin-like flavoprotein
MGASNEVDGEIIIRFRTSLERCLARSEFLDRFYERFIGSSDEVKERFAKTDFSKQHRILRGSLYLMSRAAMGLEDGREHLMAVAKTHGSSRLGIPSHHYDLWLEALIETAREMEQHFDVELEAAWREVLGLAVSIVRDHD